MPPGLLQVNRLVTHQNLFCTVSGAINRAKSNFLNILHVSLTRSRFCGVTLKASECFQDFSGITGGRGYAGFRLSVVGCQMGASDTQAVNSCAWRLALRTNCSSARNDTAWVRNETRVFALPSPASGAFSSITSAAAFLPGLVSAFGIIEVLWDHAVADASQFGGRSALAAFRFTRSGPSARGVMFCLGSEYKAT